MERAIERWNELCESVAQPDDLPTWEEAGLWTQDKLYFWKRYIDITTIAMDGARGRKAFPGGIVYVDLFGGAGICTLKESGKRFPGSALIAAHAAKPFTKIIVCEENPQYANACRTRLSRTTVANRCKVMEGDCNLLIDQVVSAIPDRTLTLAFVDPKGLDARFTTLETLSRRARRVDFVVLFADAYDINRNHEYYYRPNPDSKLDQVLGSDSNWRARLDEFEGLSAEKVRKLFAKIYQEQMGRLLGYTEFGKKVMRDAQDRPLYRLIYASKSKLGVKFWKEALKQDSSGQRRLF